MLKSGKKGKVWSTVYEVKVSNSKSMTFLLYSCVEEPFLTCKIQKTALSVSPFLALSLLPPRPPSPSIFLLGVLSISIVIIISEIFV